MRADRHCKKAASPDASSSTNRFRFCALFACAWMLDIGLALAAPSATAPAQAAQARQLPSAATAAHAARPASAPDGRRCPRGDRFPLRGRPCRSDEPASGDSLNFPPIGAGVETMAPQPGGGYAIVLGNNCTTEIASCTPTVWPYGSSPVQMVIIDRTTLTPLFRQQYSGNAADAVSAALQIATHVAQGDSIMVIVGALLGNTTQVDPAWLDVLELIVPQAQAGPYNGLVLNLGGWSAIGVPKTSTTSGPVGHLNSGRGDYYGVSHPIGDLNGYMQIHTGYLWSFTSAGFAAFNTSQSQTALSNTMRINGTDYPSGPLVANGHSCVGGFQLVVLYANSFSPLPPSYNVPANQTFATNCNDEATDVAQINSLANVIGGVINTQQGSGSAALVFLQSIGNPIVPVQFSAQQEQAARVISPLIEQLGGIADAFNKSWVALPPSPANPAYALVGSTALPGDAPPGAQIGVYAAEASSAATGYNPAEPLLLEGLLRRNYLGKFEPVASAGVQGAAGGLLPATVYQPSQPWPYSGVNTPGVRNALAWFSTALNIQYDPSSSCYMPAFPNVRAEYCDTNPIAGGGLGWGHVATQAGGKTFPGVTACGCTSAVWTAVQTELVTEMNWVGYVQAGMTVGHGSLASVLTDSTDPSFIDLASITSSVVSAVDMSGSNSAVAGFWITLASNTLKFAANLVGTDTGLRPVIGILSTVGPLGENLASFDNDTTLGAIQTTAKALPTQLSSRFIAAANQLGLFQSIIVSDYAKLRALGTNTVFQGDPFADDNVQLGITNGVKLFAYGRLLGAGYQAYGLLPDSYNPGYPDAPSDYFCGNVGDEGVIPFGAGTDSAGLTWVGFTYPNMASVPVPVYGGNPNLLALGSLSPDIFSVYSTVPKSVMQQVVTTGGLGEWPVWFFRQNFNQAGFKCSDLG